MKWKLILCDQTDYYPLIYHKNNHSDIEHASMAILDLHRKYLNIQDSDVRVEIDPYISLEGEDL